MFKKPFLGITNSNVVIKCCVNKKLNFRYSLGYPKYHAGEVRYIYINLSLMNCAGCRVQGAGCRVQGAECRMQIVKCMVPDVGCRMQIIDYRL